MAQNSPALLRVHRDAPPELDQPELAELEPLQRLFRAYGSATGWRLDLMPAHSAAKAGAAALGGKTLAAEYEMGSAGSGGRLLLSSDVQAGDRAISRAAAEPLAAALAEVLNELQRTRVALWQREAELAAGVPLVAHTTESTHLATRLEAALRSGAEAIDCQAAALYMLDETTSQLKLRAAWRLPPERFLEGARPLRGAMADLEALTGHAVAIEDTQLLPHWRIPEARFPSAVCVPVSSPTTPLGTLWAFSTSPRDFTDRQTGLWEIVAGRLAADLEREVLLRAATRDKSLAGDVSAAAQWQRDRRTLMVPQTDNLEFAAWSPGGDEVANTFHDWQVLRDGTVAIAVGGVEACSLPGALGVAQLLACMRAHGDYRHDAAEMLARVNDSLWNWSPGDGGATLAYARLDADNGRMQWAAAGQTWGCILGRKNSRALSRLRSPVGMSAEARFSPQLEQVVQGEALVMCAWGGRSQPGERPESGNFGELARCLAAEPLGRAERIVSAVRRWLEAQSAALSQAAVVVVKHR